MAHAHDTRYGTLKTAIKSVMFMGTPHRGMCNFNRGISATRDTVEVNKVI